MGSEGPAWEAIAAALNMYGVLEVLVTFGSLLKFDAVQWCSSIDQVPEMQRDIIILASKYRALDPSCVPLDISEGEATEAPF